MIVTKKNAEATGRGSVVKCGETPAVLREAREVGHFEKWLCVGIYRPPAQNEKYFIDHLSKTLGQLTCQLTC